MHTQQTCPCALVGQRCRHALYPHSCRNPCGIEAIQPLTTFPLPVGVIPPLAVCLRRTGKKNAKNRTTQNDKKSRGAASAETSTATVSKQTIESKSSKNLPLANDSSSPSRSAASNEKNKKKSPIATQNDPMTTPSAPTTVETAWEQADAAADAYFANDRGAAELTALYEVAANAAVHARAELQLNENEKWWWRDIVPSAASPGFRRSRQRSAIDSRDSNDEDEEGVSLECHESYSGMEVEKDVDKQMRRDAIIRVSQETLILRYAAMVLREKAREWAAGRQQEYPTTTTST